MSPIKYKIVLLPRYLIEQLSRDIHREP